MASAWRDFLALVVLGGSVLPFQQSYEGYKLLRIRVSTGQQWGLIERHLETYMDQVDVWRHPSALGEDMDIMLSPSELQHWTKLCGRSSMQCDVIVEDIQRIVDSQLSELSQLSTRFDPVSHRPKRDVDDTLHRLSGMYPTFEQVERWLLDLNQTESLVTVSRVGTTVEGRALYVAKIGPSDHPPGTPGVFLDTGIHAREWISPSTGVYVITQLVEAYRQSTRVRPVVEGLVWYVMPVSNPDGYVYSHTEDRFWRKNRAPAPPGVLDGYKQTACTGVDLNRNFPFHWGEVGVSTNSCSSIYPGPSSASEPETKAIIEFMSDPARRLHAYVNIHSYGQLFATRWAYTNDTPADHPQLLEVANDIAASIYSVHNVTYRTGRTPNILYAYSGGMADWAKGQGNVKFSYTTELRDDGRFGFVLPANYVIPVGEEMFAGLVTLGTRVLERAETLTTIPEDKATTETNSHNSSVTAKTPGWFTVTTKMYTDKSNANAVNSLSRVACWVTATLVLMVYT